MASKRICMFLMPIFMGSAVLVRGQVPTGTISGAVIDPSGAAVTDARVVVTSADTGFTRLMSSGDSGDFSASALTAGRYRVEAEAPGFKKLVRDDVDVVAGAITKVDMQLQLGTSSESVTVAANA